MKPMLIYLKFNADGLALISKEELERIVTDVYEQGRVDATRPTLYPTGIRRPGEYTYFKVGDSNGG